MPIALLLAEPVGALTKGLRRWRKWEGLADTEALLLKRERGRFLSRWFGPALPMAGIHLLVSIQNLDAIQAALRGIDVAKRAAIGVPEKASLLEPLLSGVGPMVGALASPMNSLLLGVIGTELGSTWWQVALGGLNWITAGLLGTAALSIAGIAAPVGIVAMLSGLAATPEGQGLFGLLQRLVPIGHLLHELVQQLSGPRSAIRNPILGAALQVGDAVAGLLAQLIGAAFFILARVVPMLGPLSTAAVHMVALGRNIVGLLGFVMDQVLTQLPALFDAKRGPLPAIIVALGLLATDVPAALLKAAGAQDIVKNALEPVRRESSSFVDEFEPSFVVKQHPLVIALGTLGASGGVLGAHWLKIITLLPLWIGDLIAWLATSPPGKVGAWVKKQLGVPPAPPSLAALPTAPTPLGLSAALGKAGMGAPWTELDAVGKAMTAATTALVAPQPNVFAGARRDLARDEVLAATRAAETAVYLRLARHAVAPAVAANLRRAEDVLRTLDRAARPAQRTYPVRDVVPVQPLQLGVRRLVVTGEGRSDAALRRFSRQVQRAMAAQVYEMDLVLTDRAN